MDLVKLLSFILTHFLGRFGYPEVFNELPYLPVHYSWQVVLRISNSVIRDTPLGIIVGSDLVGPVSATHH